ncbi:glycosyltransferase family 2 protein [Acidobacteria bacterium AH-259-A15]|nr:glycosyltransferase family 2 protein [Acidobacteria bacterium AH-259-A15]
MVFSFRNEQEVLPQLVKKTRAVLQQEQATRCISSYELIFVNDASTGRSLEILLEHAEGHDDIRIINMSRRFGVSPCVLAGMEYASGDAVIYMDADLQDPPEVIPKLLQTWQSRDKINVVHTVRLSREGESKIKLLLTRFAYHILHRITSIQLPVEAGDFKLLSRRAVDQLIRLRERRPFLRGLVCWIGFNQISVSYHRNTRYAGDTKFPVFSREVINNFLKSALISFSSFPLEIVSIAGFGSALLGFVLLVHVLIEKMRGHNIPGWMALMVTMLFLGSVQLFSIGAIGLYLNTIYEESKGRPNYIVESTFGFPRASHPNQDSSQAEMPSRVLSERKID